MEAWIRRPIILTGTAYSYWSVFLLPTILTGPCSYWSVGGICNHLREDRKVVSIDGYEDVPPNDEAALQKAVTKQPVSVAICADPSLQFYSSGILADKCCTALDHGVLVVGYGEVGG